MDDKDYFKKRDKEAIKFQDFLKKITEKDKKSEKNPKEEINRNNKKKNWKI